MGHKTTRGLDPTEGAIEHVTEGLNQLEAAANMGLVLVTLTVWGMFLWGLSWKKGGQISFYVVMGLHFFAAALGLVESNHRVAMQFFWYGLLGGVALVIGLPHYWYEPGERSKPRIRIAIGAIVAFVAMYVYLNR